MRSHHHRRRFWRNDLTAAAFPGRNRRNIASILILTGGIAAAEVLLGFGPGHFLIRERAEPDAFLAFRPWLIGLALASAVLQIGRAHVCTPVTNANVVCRLMLVK